MTRKNLTVGDFMKDVKQYVSGAVSDLMHSKVVKLAMLNIALLAASVSVAEANTAGGRVGGTIDPNFISSGITWLTHEKEGATAQQKADLDEAVKDNATEIARVMEDAKELWSGQLNVHGPLLAEKRAELNKLQFVQDYKKIAEEELIKRYGAASWKNYKQSTKDTLINGDAEVLAARELPAKEKAMKIDQLKGEIAELDASGNIEEKVKMRLISAPEFVKYTYAGDARRMKGDYGTFKLGNGNIKIGDKEKFEALNTLVEQADVVRASQKLVEKLSVDIIAADYQGDLTDMALRDKFISSFAAIGFGYFNIWKGGSYDLGVNASLYKNALDFVKGFETVQPNPVTLAELAIEGAHAASHMEGVKEQFNTYNLGRFGLTENRVITAKGADVIKVTSKIKSLQSSIKGQNNIPTDAQKAELDGYDKLLDLVKGSIAAQNKTKEVLKAQGMTEAAAAKATDAAFNKMINPGVKVGVNAGVHLGDYGKGSND